MAAPQLHQKLMASHSKYVHRCLCIQSSTLLSTPHALGSRAWFKKTPKVLQYDKRAHVCVCQSHSQPLRCCLPASSCFAMQQLCCTESRTDTLPQSKRLQLDRLNALQHVSPVDGQGMKCSTVWSSAPTAGSRLDLLAIASLPE
jgi:hypothetical protein